MSLSGEEKFNLFFKYIYTHRHFLAAQLQLQAENKIQIKK